MFSYPRRAPGVRGVVGWSGAWGEGGTLTRGGFEKRLLFCHLYYVRGVLHKSLMALLVHVL